ncbi:hypothetical protein N7507_009745 [Penicillium longicatenatum]|nr:hypothetical protein N7507_009745 [Penicillium longicatenatum]
MSSLWHQDAENHAPTRHGLSRVAQLRFPAPYSKSRNKVPEKISDEKAGVSKGVGFISKTPTEFLERAPIPLPGVYCAPAFLHRNARRLMKTNGHLAGLHESIKNSTSTIQISALVLGNLMRHLEMNESMKSKRVHVQVQSSFTVKGFESMGLTLQHSA